MRTLRNIYCGFRGELADVLSTYKQVSSPASSMGRIGVNRPAQEGCIVFLFDAWGRFVRDSAMASSCRRVTGISGNQYGAPPFKSFSDAMAHLRTEEDRIVNYNRSSGPSWHLQRSALDAINVLDPPNKG